MSVAAAVQAGRKGHRRGTHRLVPPEQTWVTIRPLLTSFGITRVADITGLDDLGIPVHQAIRPASATLAVSQGKGVTRELARVSAVMEMIEFAHAEHLTLPTVRGPAAEVADGSYGLRELQLVAGSLVSDTVLLDWVEGRTVPDNRPVLVPRPYVEMTNEFRREWAPPLFETSTNGLASGNSLDEAVLHGLYELIERDCLSEIEGMARSGHVRVDPATVSDDDCRWLMARMRAADNWFEIVDATNDLGVPCYVVNLWSPSFPVLVSGSGAHLDPAVALNRALTEAAQSRLAIISGTRESIPEQVYLLQNVRQERPAPLGDDVPVRTFDRPDQAAPTFAEDLAEVASRLVDRRDRQPFFVDLSGGHPGIAVVKVVAPGLRFEASHGLVERIPPPMTLHVFAGPTIDADTVVDRLPEAVVHPPVRHGDLLALGASAGDTIAIIDGVFFRTGAIRHKEIVHLLQQGVPVYGASSMGALRAAELDRFGMRGVGRIYRLYSSGTIDGDDEVAILHTEADDGFRSMSEAMVSIRFALRRARLAGVLSGADERLLASVAKRLPFGDRTYRRIVAEAVGDGFAGPAGDALLEHLRSTPYDAKRIDAELLLGRLRRRAPSAPAAGSPTDSAGRSDLGPARPADAVPPDVEAAAPDGSASASPRRSDQAPIGRMPMTSFLLRWIRSAPTVRIDGYPVSDLAALTVCQLFGDGYPAFHRQLVLRELVRGELGVRDDDLAVAPDGRDELVLEAARRRGLVGPDLTTVPEVFRSCLSTDDLAGPPAAAVVTALVRLYRWAPNVRVVEPIVHVLEGTEAWSNAQRLVARAQRCNAELAALRPTFNPHYIADARLRAWVGRRWGVPDPTFALLDRGFGGQPDLRARGAMFLPLDSVEPVASFPIVPGRG